MTNLSMDDIVVVEIGAYDPNVGARTLYYATSAFTTLPTDTPANTYIDGRVKQGLDINRTMFSPKATRGRSTVGIGDLVLLNGDGELDALKDWGFDGQTVTVRRGPVGGEYPSDFTTDFVGTMTVPEVTQQVVRLKLRDNQEKLNVPLQTTKYLGSGLGTLEGTADDLKGKPKPVCYGKVLNISPPCVETAKLIYQVNDGAVNSIDEVYDAGVALQSQIGPTWDHVAIQFAGGNVSVEYFAHASLFVLVGLNVAVDGYRVATSPDGETWTFRALPISAANILITSIHSYGSICIIGGVGTGPSDCRFFWSSDGIVWKESTSDQMGNSRPYGIAVGPGEGASGANRWVAVGADAQINISDDNGVTWVDSTPAGFSAEIIRDVAYGEGQFVAVGAAGKVETSPDGVTWTARTSGFGADIVLGVAYSDTLDLWVIVGTNGELATSPDGATWTMRTSGFGSATIADVRWVGELSAFMARGVNGADSKFTMSSDGITWTDFSTGLGALPPTSGGQQIAYNDSTGVTLLVTDTGVYRSEPFARTYASEADLLDDDLAPAPGAVGVYLAGGFVRLGAVPEGEITADVSQGANDAARTTAQVHKLLVARASLVPDATDTSDLDTAAPHVVGYWTDQETTIAAACDEVVASVGASWFADKSGVQRIKQLVAPTGTATETFTENDAKNLERSRTNDRGQGIPSYKSIVRYAKNYTVQDSGVAAAVSASRRAVIAAPFLESSYADATVQTAHPQAIQLADDSLLATAAAALTEATRRQGLYGVQREVYELPLKWNATTAGIELGDEIELRHNRFGLSLIGEPDLGTNFIVLGIQVNAQDRKCVLTLWGGGPQDIATRVTQDDYVRETTDGFFRRTAA